MLASAGSVIMREISTSGGKKGGEGWGGGENDHEEHVSLGAPMQEPARLPWGLPVRARAGRELIT